MMGDHDRYEISHAAEEFRAIAAERADRAEYYHAALLFQLARAEGAAKMIAAIQAAAALDGVSLEEDAAARR